MTTWYWPHPNQDQLKNYQLYLAKLDDEGKENIILGERNSNLLIPTKLDSNTKCLKFISEIYLYKQIILSPTRIAHTSRTLINHFNTNEPFKITHHGVVHLGISAHSLKYAVRKFNTLKTTPKVLETRQFTNFNPETFIEDMKNTPFYWATTLTEPNKMWDLFKSLFLEVADRHVPVRY